MKPNKNAWRGMPEISRLIESLPVGAYRRRADGIFRAANAPLAAMFGHPSPEAFLEAVNADPPAFYAVPEKLAESLEALAENGRLDHFEFRAVCRDDSLIWVSETAFPERPGDPSAGFFGFMEDVSAQKSVAWALIEAEERHRDMFENAVEGLFRLSPNDRFVTVNRSLALLLGYQDSDELLAVQSVSRDVFMEPGEMRALERLALEKGEIRFFETLARKKTGESLWASINAKAVTDAAGDLVLLEGSMIDVTEKRRSEELVRENLQRTRRLFLQTVTALGKTVQFRDCYTAAHQENVAELAVRAARLLGLSEEAVEGVRLAGLLHDIGKIKIPLRYLTKPGRLERVEWEFMREHPRTGYDILKNLNFPWPIAEMVLQHHERLDGSGYPQGLSGDRIMIEARILAVADVVDAMASHRPYRPALGVAAALEEISRNANRLYDPEVVRVVMSLFQTPGRR